MPPRMAEIDGLAQPMGKLDGRTQPMGKLDGLASKKPTGRRRPSRSGLLRGRVSARVCIATVGQRGVWGGAIF